MSLRPAMLNADSEVLAPAKLAQTLQKGGGVAALVLRAGRAEISNDRQLCGLPLRVTSEGLSPPRVTHRVWAEPA
jgi:hypothetical protein